MLGQASRCSFGATEHWMTSGLFFPDLRQLGHTLSKFRCRWPTALAQHKSHSGACGNSQSDTVETLSAGDYSLAHPPLKANPSQSVVGIDFGNLSSKIGVARHRGIDIVTNEVSNRQTPYVAAI